MFGIYNFNDIWPLWFLLNSGDIDVCKEVTFGPILSHVLEQVAAAFDIKSEVKENLLL